MNDKKYNIYNMKSKYSKEDPGGDIENIEVDLNRLELCSSLPPIKEKSTSTKGNDRRRHIVSDTTVAKVIPESLEGGILGHLSLVLESEEEFIETEENSFVESSISESFSTFHKNYNSSEGGSVCDEDQESTESDIFFPDTKTDDEYDESYDEDESSESDEECESVISITSSNIISEGNESDLDVYSDGNDKKHDSFISNCNDEVEVCEVLDHFSAPTSVFAEIITSNETKTKKDFFYQSPRTGRASDKESLRKKSKGVIKKGKWSVGSKIGFGSFGVVHVGMNHLSGQFMAVKSIPFLSSNQKEKYNGLQHEIELMRKLSHDNIVQYLGSEINYTRNILYIFQEWVPGGSLSSLLQKFGPFTISVIRTYLHQILSGLKYLHDNNILHRDIKGGNILVDNSGIVKLADFGSSREILSNPSCDIGGKENDELMLSLSMKGTPYFMAPEVIEGKYGTKADIWSVGGVILQMLTCEPPWKSFGFTTPMSLFCHLQSTNDPPPIDSKKTTVSLKRVMNNCFERDITKRKSAEILLKDSFFQENNEDEEKNQDSSSVVYEKSPIFCKKKSNEREKNKTPKRIKNDNEIIITNDWPKWAKKKALVGKLTYTNEIDLVSSPISHSHSTQQFQDNYKKNPYGR